jgi:hypothetical protein
LIKPSMGIKQGSAESSAKGPDPAWPLPDGGVAVDAVLEAVRLGRAQIIARYLRENERLNPRVLLALAELFDPNPELQQPMRVQLKRRRREGRRVRPSALTKRHGSLSWPTKNIPKRSKPASLTCGRRASAGRRRSAHANG